MTRCAAGGAAEKLGKISPGDRLLTISGSDVSSLPFGTPDIPGSVMAALVGAARPMTLVFESALKDTSTRK